jgi:hypothetical protein
VAQSYVEYQGDGTSTTFAVPFPFIVRSHVKLYLDYDIVDRTFASALAEGTDFDWTSDTIVELNVAPSGSEKLTVIRETPSGAQVVPWQDGSNLVAFDLNTSDLQNLYVVQEQQDRNDASVIATASATAAAAASAQAAQAAAVAASGDAQVAISTANGVANTANSAVNTANSAVSTANAATATANNAVAVANGVASLSRSAVEAAAILLNASFGIGRPGATPFGVGPFVPSTPVTTGVSQRDYNPIHVASGSFI